MLDQLHFKYALEDKLNQQIKLQCFVATEDAEYIVKEINLQTAEGGTSGATWVEYVCDLNVTPLKSETIDNFAPGSTTADASANLALSGTGWSVGYCDVTKQRTAAGTNCSPFDCLGDIAKAYSCDVTFDTTHKLVNLHKQQGADRGAYFAEQLNLKTLQVQSNSRDYCTRLYPIGKDGLTIADVNGGVPYVSNYQYSTEVIVKRWVDNRYTVAADLMADAQDRLDYMSKPTRAYSANIIDLARVSDQWGLLDFALGDTITLLSYSAGVREQQRIVKVDRYLDEPQKSTCEISNKIASLDDIVLRVSDAADAIDAATDSTGTIMGSSVQVTNPDGTYTTLTSAVATIGTLIATKATITDLQAATARIATLEATSVTTDYLTANYLTADSVQATYATIDNLNSATARITTLESNQITTTYLNAHYASIDLSNIGTGIIQTAMIATGAVQTAQIADGSITDAKIVSLSANRITAGTLSVERLIITGSTSSIVYTINEANGTAQLSQTTIDGGSLTQRTITADRIVSGAITANEIASHTITATQIAANTITAAQIAAGTITATQIASGTITSTQINVSNLISALNISTDTLYAQRITSTGSPVYANIGTFTMPWIWTDDKVYVQTASYSGMMIYDSSTSRGVLGIGQAQLSGYDDTSLTTGIIPINDKKRLVIQSCVTTDNNIYKEGSFEISSDGASMSYHQLNKSTSTDTAAAEVIVNSSGIGLLAPNTLVFIDGTNFSVSTSGAVKVSELDFGTSYGGACKYIGSNNIMLQCNYGGGVYLGANGGVYATNTAASSYVAVTASGFNNGSLESYKQDIAAYTDDALSIIHGTGLYAYRLIDEVESGVDHTNYGCVIGDAYNTPAEIISADGKAVSQYSMVTLSWRAIQQLDDNVIALAQRVDSLTVRDDYQDNEIALLNAQITALQARVAALEAVA